MDHSFVSGLGESPSDTELVPAVVSLGSALSLAVVAEGVETDRHVTELRRLAARTGRGTCSPAPVPGAELAPRLRATLTGRGRSA